ncbi:helix-turn-helix domain-containing protein [Paenibacillus sp. J5C_2022]|uniref:helix-turn-helix domain-containing protein n=1 Tax=Paenibacillus sp. J5C2022 TaxID=2977129 RepID=UPI0021CEAAE6|nr:helix-turn-helix domain-containing protein [Paenibacillus sp. J5C2022]MCU6711450.1 helix-turn-helix domain-containing protein [Paenibacillus sp. J5C2022]
MNWSYFKSKLFLKYIWSYLFILLIPLVLTTVFIYQNAVSNLQSEIEHSRLSQLTQAKVMVDGRMKELNEVASRISYDTRLTAYRVHDPYFIREAIQALDQYKSTSSIVDELLLYFRGDNDIYSTQGLYSFDVFSETFAFRNWKKESVLKDLNSMTFRAMRPADTVLLKGNIESSILAYLVPITPNSPNPHGMVMYFIKENELTSLIDSVLGNYKGATYILDQNGRLLVDNWQGEALPRDQAESLAGLAPGIHNKEINGKPHSIVSVSSDSNGWSYVTVMPSEQFFSRVVHVRSFIIMLFIITLLAGVAIALVLARMQYRPISTLVEFATSGSEEKHAEEGGARRGNELERIRTALQHYSSRIDMQEPYARNHFLSILLKHGHANNMTPELQSSFNLQFDRSHLFVIVMEWEEMKDSEEERKERQDMMEMLLHIDFPELSAHAYGVELTQLERIALIVNFHYDESQAELYALRPIVEAVRLTILDTFDVAPAIGVGTCYRSLNQLNQSFIEACSAIQWRASGNGGGHVSYFEKLQHTPDRPFWIPDSSLMKLVQSLKQGSFDVAAEVIGDSMRPLHTPDLSIIYLRCIYFDLLNTMLKTASELGMEQLAHDIAPNVMNSHSPNELEVMLKSLASRICEQAEQLHETEEQSQIEQIVSYIDEHFTDQTLSLETVAFHFSISPSHLSRSFKEKMEVNFIQYIWQRRLEEVTHQLKTTSVPLKEIIIGVGYLDTSNFIRKFKKETGYTPGQYRKQFSELESS